MQQDNLKAEVILVDEFTKPQPPLDEQQMGNKETVQKTIKKYQNKVNEMIKIIQKQKKQNDSLKDKLKTLNDNLNTVINKVTHKPIKHEQPPRDDVIRKQLDNQIKKNVILQKEITQLRAKVKINDSAVINEMDNQIKQKDKIIQQLNASIKTYAKIQKQQNNIDIYKRQEQLNHKVTLLNEEILHLKKKFKEQKKHQEIQQKNIKKQHEQIISLETKYKPTQGMVATTTNHLRASLSPQKSISNQDYKKLKDNFQTLETTKKANEKQFKQQIQNLKAKIKILEKEVEEGKQNLNRKQKQNNILMSRLKEIQRKENKTLEPLQVKKPQDFNLSGIFDHRKEFRGLVHLPGSYQKFDDTESLSLEKNYKIQKILFTWFQEHILSLDTTYLFQDSTVKEIPSFKIPHSYQNVKKAQLIFNEFEYIKEIEIYCSKLIQFIRIKTSRDQLFEVGSDRNCLKCKKFTFDIRANQKPIAFLGTIDNKKSLGNEGKQMLISFGLQIKKKEVTGKSKFSGSFGRTESIKKNASKSLFDNLVRNDKNVEQNP